ncbi:MAG: septum formation initiator family protein [Myxococcaceae bacterium]|nr:septum formation initiator family protein [Myxococcaceae bacterium]
MSPRRKLIWAAVAAASVLAVWSASAEGGFRRYVKLNRDVSALREKNLKLAQRNAQLTAEIRALHESPEAQEQAAREELGFVRPQELIISLEDKR